ncbi:DMT family transporter [Thalassospira alkalitolerans]|uniref:DMT family transporter n=1 Tax=Thalassospira alkalitolerans TaxID=1293890 RepID=UPI0030EDAF47|tara:strand:+ start:75790 stop:76737 length:948 start_codon:yes stop_codon:yes gene_type:complete
MKNNAYIVFCLLALAWGLTFLFNKTASTLISPMQIVMVRVIMGFLPVLVFAIARKSLHWQHLRYLHHFVIMSLLAATVYYFAFAKGISLLPSSVAGMLSGAIPMFSFIAAAIFLRSEPVNMRSVTGLLFGFAGVLVIAKPWNTGVSGIDLNGVLYVAIGSGCVGLSFVYVRKFLSPLGISPIALCTYQLGLASATLLVITDFNGIGAIFTDWKIATGLFAGLGLLGTGFAFMCYYYLIGKLGAVKTAGVTYIPPVIGLLTGSLILGESVSAIDILATAMILSGVFIIQSGRTPAPVLPTPPTSPDVRAHNLPERA